MFKFIIQFLFILLIFSSCGNPDPNINEQGKDELKAHEVKKVLNPKDQKYKDVIYVPIYSDIYADRTNQKILLAATLSIRNTSATDSLFLSKIDYYNTDGELVRSYAENIISLSPMGTINYVIEKDDDTGGPGANFIVELTSQNVNVKPLIQAVMVGYIGNKAFTFLTDGYSIGEGNK